MSNPPRPLRIACLHGFRQNAQRFRQKTGALRKSLERNIHLIDPSLDSSSSSDAVALAELVYIDAPFIVERILEEDIDPDTKPQMRTIYSPNAPAFSSLRSAVDSDKTLKNLTQRTWWAHEGRSYTGWQQSKEYLRAHFAEQQFDGILGFSQGAIITSLLCAIQENPRCYVPEFSSVRFAIMFSGFPSRADEHQHLLVKPINLPSMHVWGLKDETIPAYASRKLAEKFRIEDRITLEHSNGHIVPSDAACRNSVCEFLLPFAREQYKAAKESPRAAL